MTGYKNNAGYTLVEAIVAMGIFVLIAVLGTGIFTSILGAQKRTIQQQNTAQELRFLQDVVSRDVREARTLTCNNPDPNGKASSFTLSKSSDGADPVTYNFDVSQTLHVITKTQDNTTSPLTSIDVESFEVFCNDLGNDKAFLTLNVVAEGSPSPYQVSITPRSGVLK